MQFADAHPSRCCRSAAPLHKDKYMVAASIGDVRFFARSGPHPLQAVAEAARGVAPQSDLVLLGISPLQAAGPRDVSFLDNRRYATALEATLAGAVILHPDMLSRLPAASLPIVTTTPYEAWARVAALFHPVAPVSPGIHAA